jgi:hypothetical protein
MHLTLKIGTYEVIAFAKLSADYVLEIPAIDFLHEQSKSGDTKGSVNGFMNLFERYADGGTSKLTVELFHEVDNTDKIFEFIKGQIRIFCFKDKNKVILTHGALKKTKKVDPSEVARAVACKNIYFKK